MPRSVKEWVGKTDDSVPPPRVRLRIFEREGGICYLCGGKINVGDQWDVDHVVAVINSGANTESNLKPVHRACHRVKTKADVVEKTKVQRIRQKHVLPKPKSKWGNSKWKRKMDGTAVPRGE